MCHLFSSQRTDLVPAYVRLLRDSEAEVRIAAAGKVTMFCKIINPQQAIQQVLPCVKVGIQQHIIQWSVVSVARH